MKQKLVKAEKDLETAHAEKNKAEKDLETARAEKNKAEKDLETARVEKNSDAAGSSDEVENLRHKLQV